VKTHRLSVHEARQQLAAQPDALSVELFRHGTLQVKLYAPRGRDPQTPHTRDEIYVVASGTGWFWNGDSRAAFQPGDLLFAAAGQPHRFEDFTDDFLVWVMFYGPEGGE
jgi:mannose-6-phosphate isomerase-like protein (cupin superfamily)